VLIFWVWFRLQNVFPKGFYHKKLLQNGIHVANRVQVSYPHEPQRTAQLP